MHQKGVVLLLFSSLVKKSSGRIIFIKHDNATWNDVKF